jgi:hypothetical protein
VGERPAAGGDVGAVREAHTGPRVVWEPAVHAGDAHDAVRLGERERSKQQPVDDAEDRGRRADGEGGREERRAGDERLLAGAAGGVA